ncbi:MAG: TraR/DksA C4-type zinc finger protein [Myxococcota bacterium]
MEMLTEHELGVLHEALLALKAELEAGLAQSREAAQVVDLDDPIGRLSRMDALQQQAMAQAGRERSRQRLDRVQAALRRVKVDEYGECLRCDEPIGFGRLEAAPEVATCVRCQGEIEGGRHRG